MHSLLPLLIFTIPAHSLLQSPGFLDCTNITCLPALPGTPPKRATECCPPCINIVYSNNVTKCEAIGNYTEIVDAIEETKGVGKNETEEIEINETTETGKNQTTTTGKNETTKTGKNETVAREQVDGLVCIHVMPECEPGCKKCKIHPQTETECAKAECLDAPTVSSTASIPTPSVDPIMCIQSIPQCPATCKECKIYPQTDTACAYAKCLDPKSDSIEEEDQLVCPTLLPDCPAACKNCTVHPQTATKCSWAECMDKKKKERIEKTPVPAA